MPESKWVTGKSAPPGRRLRETESSCPVGVAFPWETEPRHQADLWKNHMAPEGHPQGQDVERRDWGQPQPGPWRCAGPELKGRSLASEGGGRGGRAHQRRDTKGHSLPPQENRASSTVTCASTGEWREGSLGGIWEEGAWVAACWRWPGEPVRWTGSSGKPTSL